MLWLLYPFLIAFVIVVTANHFLFDAFLGAVTAGVSAYGAMWLARARPNGVALLRRLSARPDGERIEQPSAMPPPRQRPPDTHARSAPTARGRTARARPSARASGASSYATG